MHKTATESAPQRAHYQAGRGVNWAMDTWWMGAMMGDVSAAMEIMMGVGICAKVWRRECQGRSRGEVAAELTLGHQQGLVRWKGGSGLPRPGGERRQSILITERI